MPAIALSNMPHFSHLPHFRRILRQQRRRLRRVPQGSVPFERDLSHRQ